MTLPLSSAYERLLSEVRQRLGATHAELLLRRSRVEQPVVLARDGVPPEGSGVSWLELPINEGSDEVGRLRIAFGPGVELPGPAERAPAQLLLELAALLTEDRVALNWGTLRQAGRRILAVTEEELQRIILDIHDGPVQNLFVVSSRLAVLEARLAEQPPELRELLLPEVARTADLVSTALQEIKTTLSAFRPAAFQQRGLPAVLHGLAMQHEANTGNRVELLIEGEIPHVSLAVKIALYRVLQEALANAFRHAGVDHQEARLRHRDGWVELEVHDHGKGFSPPQLDGPEATEREEHIGLRGMRERAHLVGGTLRVDSRPGRGTVVILRVPVDA